MVVPSKLVHFSIESHGISWILGIPHFRKVPYLDCRDWKVLPWPIAAASSHASALCSGLQFVDSGCLGCHFCPDVSGRECKWFVKGHDCEVECCKTTKDFCGFSHYISLYPHSYPCGYQYPIWGYDIYEIPVIYDPFNGICEYPRIWISLWLTSNISHCFALGHVPWTKAFNMAGAALMPGVSRNGFQTMGHGAQNWWLPVGFPPRHLGIDPSILGIFWGIRWSTMMNWSQTFSDFCGILLMIFWPHGMPS